MNKKNLGLYVLVIGLLLGGLGTTVGLGQSIVEKSDEEKGDIRSQEIGGNAISEWWSLFAVVGMKLSVIPYYSNISGCNLPTADGVYPGIMVLNLKWSNAVSDIACFGILTQETETYQNNTLGSCLIFMGLLVIETKLGAINYSLAGGALGVHISIE